MIVLGMHPYHYHYLLIMILVFFVSPSLLAVSTFIKIYYVDEIILFSSEYFNDVYFGFELLSLFQYGIFAIMLIVYPIYSAVFSIEKFFVSRTPLNSAIIEYEILGKIVYVLFPFFIFAILYSIAMNIEKNPLTAIIEIVTGWMPYYLIIILIGVIFFIVASALLKILALTIRKDFRFYYAKIIIKTIPKKNEVERVRSLVRALDSYNRYLRRSLRLQINDIKIVYSKILLDTSLDKENVIKELSMAFDDVNDKFKPTRYLSNSLRISDTEHFLARESTGKKIGEWASITATIVSTIAAVIGVLSTLGVLLLT